MQTVYQRGNLLEDLEEAEVFTVEYNYEFQKTHWKVTSNTTLHSNVVTQNEQQEAAKVWKSTSNIHAIPAQ